MNETAVAGPERASKNVAKMEERIVGSKPSLLGSGLGRPWKRVRMNASGKKGRAAQELGMLNDLPVAVSPNRCCAAAVPPGAPPK